MRKTPALVFGGATLLVAACALILVWALAKHQEFAPNNQEASTETSDALLSQYNERPGTAVLPDGEQSVVQGCGLRFSFKPESAVVTAAGEIAYTATLSNNGTEACHNASFSLYYADGEEFVSATPAPSASTYYWSAGTLNPGARYSVHIRTTLSALTTQIANEACATADNTAGDICPQNVLFAGKSGVTTPPAPDNASVRTGKELGTWIWESPVALQPTHRTSLLDAARSAGFTAVYITIDDYLKVAALSEGTTKAAKEKEYMTALAEFVEAAHVRGMAVDVEAGARDWAEPENRTKGYTLIDFALRYNKQNPTVAVRGFQYDVEPYLLSRYEDDKASVLLEFVTFIDESARRIGSSNLSFSVVIPHFYDSAQAWTPAFLYKGKSAHAFTHLLDTLEQTRKSTVIIMAYRNFLDGEDGTFALVEPELKEAGSTSTEVIVAQETGNVDPAYVTFYGLSKREFLSAVSSIYSTLENSPRFGGVAVHYLDTFLTLE